jgi:regulatory Fis family protein
MSLEKSTITSAIADAGGNISKAAGKLGVSRRTLQLRMRMYGISRGKSGRPKYKIHYSKHKKLYTAGAVAAGVLVGVALLRRRGTSA